MYEASQIDCSKDSVTNMKILFEMSVPFFKNKYYFMFAKSFSRRVKNNPSLSENWDPSRLDNS